MRTREASDPTNKCICSHNQYEHVHVQGEVKWCANNGVLCDCFQFQDRDERPMVKIPAPFIGFDSTDL